MGRPAAALGLTLLELMIGMLIGAILLVLGLPAFRGWIDDLEMRDEVARLTNAMALARAEALKTGRRVNLCPSSDGARCAEDGRWEQGWIVFSDDDGDGDRADEEAVIRVEPSSRRGVSVRGNRPLKDYVSYTSLGATRMVNGALQMGTFTVCRPGRDAVEAVLANGGRVRVARTGTRCP
jgi:type IV fimbrial biogenesis protein FimT